MLRLRRAALLLGATVMAFVACSGARGPAVPEVVDHLIQETSWYRAEVRGIRVYSNTAPDALRSIAERIAQFLNIIELATSIREFKSDRSVDLVIFGSRSQWQEFAPRGVAGHAYDDHRGYRLGLVSSPDTEAVLFHELVHLVLYIDPGPRYPSWYHEGLAEVLGSATIRQDVAIVGGVPDFRKSSLALEAPLPLDEILRDRAIQRSESIARFYADAFAFVHYALLGRPVPADQRLREFSRFVDRTRVGAPWPAALDLSFSISRDDLESGYQEHRRQLSLPSFVAHVFFDLEKELPDIEIASVSEAAIARQLASYARTVGGNWPLVDELWRRVQSYDPDDAEARINRALALAQMNRWGEAEAQLASLPPSAEPEPDRIEAHAWVSLARFREGTEGIAPTTQRQHLLAARARFEELLARRPDDSRVLYEVGQTYVADRAATDLARGLAALQRAHRLDPRSPRVRLALAELLARTNDREAARPHLEAILDVDLPEEMRARAAELLSSLDRSS